MKRTQIWQLMLLAPFVMMMGCADSSTTGNIRNYDIAVNIHNNTAPVNLTFPLNVDATSASEQTTENASDIAPDLRLQLTEGGGTGSMAGADSVLKDVASKATSIIKKMADGASELNPAKPDSPTITPPVVQPPEEPPVVTPPEEPVQPEEPVVYETQFLRTSSGPEGKSLVLCQGDTTDFSCESGGVPVPFVMYEDGFKIFMTTETPEGDIVCTKDDKAWRYRADAPLIEGTCPEVPATEQGVVETYYTTGKEGDRQVWKIPKAGKEYNIPLNFTFSDGYSISTMNTIGRWEEPNGMVYRPGTGEVTPGDPLNDPNWTPHGGIIVYGPYGNTSTELTLKEIVLK